jgi:hypothetical protein
MRTSFHHQSEAQPPNGPLTAATSPIPHLRAAGTCKGASLKLSHARRHLFATGNAIGLAEDADGATKGIAGIR